MQVPTFFGHSLYLHLVLVRWEGTVGVMLIQLKDLNLPKSIVTRLAKGVLPPNTQIQGNAMLAMTKSATVFVNYLASQCVQQIDPSMRLN